jgi:cytochrome oxidase Cu insertion factor (SCO1/SenC/PrrC family)
VRTLIKRFLVLALSVTAFAGAAQAQHTPVAVGQQAPDFTLADQNGRKHTLSAERGKRPLVLVFYRGYW